MTKRRWFGVVVAVGLVAYSAALALARPPATDEGKAARVAAMYDGFKNLFTGVPEVTVTELEALEAKEDVVVVDVRPPEEREVSMIPGAITSETYEANPEAYADKVAVAYCTIGFRSGQWAKAQRAEGHDVRNLAGSILAWTHAGLPLEHDGEPTKRVHVYGERWNLARSDYDAVW